MALGEVRPVNRRHYTVAEVAALAGTTEAAVRQAHARGRMPKGHLVAQPGHGRQLVFPRRAIDRWLPERPRRGRPPKASAS